MAEEYRFLVFQSQRANILSKSTPTPQSPDQTTCIHTVSSPIKRTTWAPDKVGLNYNNKQDLMKDEKYEGGSVLKLAKIARRDIGLIPT